MSDMKYAIFLGCTVPVRGFNYELSARKVCAKLGIELVDIHDFACCGYPIESVHHDSSLAVAAMNLALAENPGMFVIDVRRLEELTEKGVIDTGDVSFTHIALEEFIAQMGMWPMDKDAKVVIYCGSGHRSTMAAAILAAYGYSDVTSLKGGFGGWVEAAFPVLEFAAP